jgi:hypothetical protein
MLNFLCSLFKEDRDVLRVTNWYLSEPVKLPHPVTTGFGRRVTVVCPYDDIEYKVVDRNVKVLQAMMSTGSTMGRDLRVNIDSPRTGEAWFTPSLSPSSTLVQHVSAIITDYNSSLRGVMFAKWRAANPTDATEALCEAINNQDPVERIRQFCFGAETGQTIKVTFLSPKRGLENRVLVVDGLKGEMLLAKDCKDGRFKTFRLDRISNARPGDVSAQAAVWPT